MIDALGKLSPRQQALLNRWLPGAKVERDHSWGLVETTVLEVIRAGSRFIVKAGGAGDHHLERELHAHRHWLGPWVSRGRAPVLVHGSAPEKLLVSTYLPGELVLGSGNAGRPDVFRQAGELLALLHAQPAVRDVDYERRANRKSLAPRNWLAYDDVVSIIDFGRAAMRPAFTDLSRLAAQDFRTDPGLERAFLDGYGSDPRETGGWHRNRVREAVGTACWAYGVGNESFEAQGHRMIAEVLSARSS